MTTFQFYEVGGCVRDAFLGVDSKDVDFTVVAPAGAYEDAASAFAELEADLTAQGFKIFESRPEFLTIRAQVPSDHPLAVRTKVADFVLARKDGPYSDGRRPDYVLPGSLEDDLSRRDFTVNALARTVDGRTVDLFHGLDDLRHRKLRFVGAPYTRVHEDGLRVMRALRFKVTKDFQMTEVTRHVVFSKFAAESLSRVSVERIREELVKMFRADTLKTVALFREMPEHLLAAIFRDGLRLDATLAG